MNVKPLTKKSFERLLKKAAQPKKPDSKETETLESHRADDYTDKRKSRDKTEDTEG